MIPFRRKDWDIPAAPIYINHKEFTTRRPFIQRPESYSMSLSYHLDSESLVAGSTAKVSQRTLNFPILLPTKKIAAQS